MKHEARNEVYMEVIILGSGTGVPSLKRGAPGLVVKVKRQILLFDSGAGTLNRLLKIGIDYRKLDYIFYTHFHPDHVAELVPILFACKYHSKPRIKPLRIIGPKGLKELYHGLSNVYGEWIRPEKCSLELIELTGRKYKENGWTVYTKPMVHSKVSIGYRLESKSGKTVVYSGDTGYCKSIVDLSRGADILILECSFPERYKFWGHLTPGLAGKIARESGCKHLVLTHLYPVCDRYDILSECKKEFKGKISLSRDFLCIK